MALQFRTAKRWVTRRVTPDFTNQLDLFSEAPLETPAPVANAPARRSGVVPARPRPQQLDFGPWEPLPAEFAARPITKPTPGSTSEDRGAGNQPPLRPEIGALHATSPVVETGDRREPSAGKVLDIEPEQRPSRDFRITAATRIGQGSLQEKARDNLGAIRLLKTLEAENREAADEEKLVLARYVGWGAMPNVFGHYPPEEWRSTAGAVRELLTGPELESARASTPNAHYTSPPVIEAIWSGLQHLGLGRGAQILEPAMGVGHFFGLMPESMEGGHRTGVELDSITARIARKLYPDATIFAQGFEETPLPDNYFDAILGNVPFGDYAVHDPAMKHQLTRAIHDYFFAKSLEKLRPGGVMALITSRYTMDKQADVIRRHLAEQADLLGAIRLPNTAFKGNAGTEVTTDILFLRKRAPGAPPAGHAWRGLETIDSTDGPIAVNEYYARHPEMMLGIMKLQGTMYRGSEPTLEGRSRRSCSDGRARNPCRRALTSQGTKRRGPPHALLAGDAFTGIKDGAYAERNGAIVIRDGASFKPTTLTGTAAARDSAMMPVRDAVRLVFRTQLENAPEERIVEGRQLLNSIYDSFVGVYGDLSSRDNLRAFQSDPDQPLLLSLEIYDAETRHAQKTAIFDRRTLEQHKPAEHVETAAEALAISLNETGTDPLAAPGEAHGA